MTDKKYLSLTPTAWTCNELAKPAQNLSSLVSAFYATMSSSLASKSLHRSPNPNATWARLLDVYSKWSASGSSRNAHLPLQHRRAYESALRSGSAVQLRRNPSRPRSGSRTSSDPFRRALGTTRHRRDRRLFAGDIRMLSSDGSALLDGGALGYADGHRMAS